MTTVGIIISTIIICSIVFWNCQNRQDVIRIGAILPLTGGMAPSGLSGLRGMDLAVEEINAAGGINGRRLEIIYEDSQAEARIGVSAFNKLHMIDRVPLVFGSITSVILAIQPEANKNNVILINTQAISPLINERAEEFLFNLVVNGETEAIAMANKFQSNFTNESIAVFYANIPAAIYTKDIFVQNLRTLGNTNYITESHEVDAGDFRLQLDRIRRSGTKYGYLLAFSNKDFADIVRQTREMNIDMQWFSISNFVSSETLELAGEAAEGIICSYPKIFDETLYSAFLTKYKERYGAIPDVLTVNSFDNVHLLAAVMKQYGTAALDIQRGLRSIDNFYGIFGNFKLSCTGRQIVDRELIWKTVENGTFRIQE
jgi:branched-chain amino acid transport system substrate-binding protein